MFWKRMAVLIPFAALFAAAALAQNSAAPATRIVGPGYAEAPPRIERSSSERSPGRSGNVRHRPERYPEHRRIREQGVHRPLPGPRPDGMITIPLFGDMKAEGLTPLQLKKQLTETF